ncbi:MAG: GDSL-type esterase/lipase family protein [Chitinophagaceae bacterium]
MIRIFFKSIFLIISLFSSLFGIAQLPAFSDEIKAFKFKDSISAPPKNAILFVGSSSFRKWTDVQSYFPNFIIINRGFGGSTLPDVIRYANDIIFPYQPKQIVIYCGENDFEAADSPTAETVFNRFKQLFELIRKKMPDENIVYVSMKPSPSRAQKMYKEEEANKLIKNFLSTQKNASFVDVYHKMLDASGSPIKEIFLEDSLHMNAKGYAIWQKAIEPYLMK